MMFDWEWKKTEEKLRVERHRADAVVYSWKKGRSTEEVNSIIKCHREFKDNEYRKRHLGLLIRKPQICNACVTKVHMSES